MKTHLLSKGHKSDPGEWYALREMAQARGLGLCAQCLGMGISGPGYWMAMARPGPWIGRVQRPQEYQPQPDMQLYCVSSHINFY